MRQLDSETLATQDITSALTVLTHTPSATVATRCALSVALSGLDESGGTFLLYVTIGGVPLQPYPMAVACGATATAIIQREFLCPANAEIIAQILSPNAADTSVGITATLWDVTPLQPATAGRQIGIESDGDLTKVNALDGHTPQTGDVYSIASNVTHGNAALKSLIDTVDTVANAIKAKTDNLKASWNDLDAAGVRAALGMSSANLDTQLSGIGGYVDCLPESWVVPATAAEVAAVQTHGDSTWATATGFSTHSVNDIVTALQAVAADFKATGYATAENLAAAKAILDKLDGLVEVIA